jgi:hypothetical protein
VLIVLNGPGVHGKWQLKDMLLKMKKLKNNMSNVENDDDSDDFENKTRKDFKNPIISFYFTDCSES